MKKRIIKVCAWCGRLKTKGNYIPFNPSTLDTLKRCPDVTISHGMCPNCSKKCKEDYYKSNMGIRRIVS